MANQELKDNIISWLKYDNEIKEMQKLIRLKRKEKKEVTNDIVQVMRSNEIECFDAGGEGKLIYTKNKTKAPLSKKHLLASLGSYFNGDNEGATKLATFILSSREDKVKETIKRKMIKKQ
tara:strand:+ start:337 stop:696 length:360 start_codon:yes stop_codon:yes gene_type:complete